MPANRMPSGGDNRSRSVVSADGALPPGIPLLCQTPACPHRTHRTRVLSSGYASCRPAACCAWISSCACRHAASVLAPLLPAVLLSGGAAAAAAACCSGGTLSAAAAADAARRRGGGGRAAAASAGHRRGPAGGKASHAALSACSGCSAQLMEGPKARSPPAAALWLTARAACAAGGLASTAIMMPRGSMCAWKSRN